MLNIDIDEDLDERGSSSHLERITRHLSLTCIFTVMQNSISALESMEFVKYDLCFIADNLTDTCSVSAIEFLRIVKIIGYDMPVILLTRSASDMQQEGLPATGFHPTNRDSLKFSSALCRPYTRSDMCITLCHAFASSIKVDSIVHTNSGNQSPTSVNNLRLSPIFGLPIGSDTSVGAAVSRENSFQAALSSNPYWGLQERTRTLPHSRNMYEENCSSLANSRYDCGIKRKRDISEFLQTDCSHSVSYNNTLVAHKHTRNFL
jgi:hypothetical protein